MARFRAALLLALFMTAVVGRTAITLPVHNPISRRDAKASIAASTEADGLHADEAAPLKVAKCRRRTRHAPPHSFVLLGQANYRPYLFGFRYFPVSLAPLPSLRLGPDTPPPNARAFVPVLA